MIRRNLFRIRIEQLICRDVQIEIDSILFQLCKTIVDRIGKAGIGTPLFLSIKHKKPFNRMSANHIVAAPTQFRNISIYQFPQFRRGFFTDERHSIPWSRKMIGRPETECFSGTFFKLYTPALCQPRLTVTSGGSIIGQTAEIQCGTGFCKRTGRKIGRLVFRGFREEGSRSGGFTVPQRDTTEDPDHVPGCFQSDPFDSSDWQGKRTQVNGP